MKGLIMIGYPGVGKSSCAGKENCIDLESGNFWIGDYRAEDWYIPYCNIALHLASQGYTVFTSSHRNVVDYLKSVPLPENIGKVVVFCPRGRDRKEWIDRLQKRYNQTGLNKDYKALMHAKEGYLEDIIELVNCGFPVYQPAWSIDYDLMDYVHKARYDWCTDSGTDGDKKLFMEKEFNIHEV